MNEKKAKAIRKIVKGLDRKFSDIKLIAKSPSNLTTAVLHPQSKRGVIQTIKRSTSRGK